MTSGREREAYEIVRFERAAEVGRLLLGELNGPMEPIFVELYVDKPRKELRARREHIRSFLRGELTNFCRANFLNMDAEDLAKLYEPLFSRGSDWYLPLVDFVRDFGKFRPNVLKGSPLHSTIHISPWGLQTDFPEMHLVKDLAVSFNDAVDIEETELTPYRTKWLYENKQKETRTKLADLNRRGEANRRSCILSCFNLIEAYINGLAWDYVQTHDISSLSQDNRNVLTEFERPVKFIDKLIKIPRLVTEKDTGALHQSRDPLKSFIEIVKPYRDAIVHASPFTAPEKFGGYDKLAKLYDLDLATVRQSVNLTVGLIGAIHNFVDGVDELPNWMPKRTEDGKFVVEVG